MQIEEFKESLKKESSHFILIILLCLNYVGNSVEYANIIGCMWVSFDSFIVNNKKLHNFIGKKINTMNRNFQTHNFKRDKKQISPNLLPIINVLEDPKNWNFIKCPGFTKFTTEKEAEKWPYVGPKGKRRLSIQNEPKPANPAPQFNNTPQNMNINVSKSTNSPMMINAPQNPVISNDHNININMGHDQNMVCAVQSMPSKFPNNYVETQQQHEISDTHPLQLNEDINDGEERRRLSQTLPQDSDDDDESSTSNSNDNSLNSNEDDFLNDDSLNNNEDYFCNDFFYFRFD